MPRVCAWDNDKWEDMGLPYTEAQLVDLTTKDYSKIKKTWNARQQYCAFKRRKADTDKKGKKRRDEERERKRKQDLLDVQRDGEEKLNNCIKILQNEKKALEANRNLQIDKVNFLESQLKVHENNFKLMNDENNRLKDENTKLKDENTKLKNDNTILTNTLFRGLQLD